MDYSPPGSSVHGDSPGKNTGVGCHAFLQGIFLIQGSNLCLLWLLHWQAGSLPSAPPGKLLYLGRFVKVEFEQFQGGQVLSSLPKATPSPKVLLLLHAFGWVVWLLRIPAGGVSDFPSLKIPLDPDC